MRAQSVLAPNPSVFTGRGTNTYLVGDGPAVLCIDPGPDDEAHLEAVVAAAAGEITHVLLSHSHPDHRPGARRLAGMTGATVHALDPGGGDDGAVPLSDGERVSAGEVTLQAVHTPGHAADHLCFFEPDTRTLFSGDHVLSGMTTVISPPEGDMSDYMRSLERVRALQPRVILPGHGPRVDDAMALLDTYLSHRREREEQVWRAARDRGPGVRPADLVAQIYRGYPEDLWPLAARSVEAHLDKLAREGRALRHGGDAEGPTYTVR